MSRKSLRRPTTSDDQLAIMRARVRAECKDRPGIYRMHSADGEVVYVGKSKRIRTRLMSYFRCSFPEDKGARILRDAVRIDWEYTPSEFAALLLELQQIKRLRPRFNVAMKRDDRNFVFIKVVKSPAPKLIVVRGASDDSAPHYGPFQGAQAVNEAVRELHDVLSMRDCSLDTRMHFADQRELFQLARTPGCIRYEVKKCLGPCVGGCTEGEYLHRVALARAFLDAAGFTHRAGPDWKNPGSERSFFSLGKGLVGASRAAWNAAQFSALREKMRRSASISSALESALSITKSLIER